MFDEVSEYKRSDDFLLFVIELDLGLKIELKLVEKGHLGGVKFSQFHDIGFGVVIRFRATNRVGKFFEV